MDLYDITERQRSSDSSRDLAEYREARRQKRQRIDNALFTAACIVAALFFALALWMLP